MDHLRSGVQDQPGQHGETLVSTKNTKIKRKIIIICDRQLKEKKEAGRGGSRL